jgi:hypothetical protein
VEKAIRVHTGFLVCDRSGHMTMRSRRPKLSELSPSQFAFEVKVRVPIEEREVVLGNIVIELPSEADPARKPSIESVKPL